MSREWKDSTAGGGQGKAPFVNEPHLTVDRIGPITGRTLAETREGRVWGKSKMPLDCTGLPMLRTTDLVRL